LHQRVHRVPPLESFDPDHPAVFVLSTGRAGTQTLAALVQLAPNLSAHHEPSPRMYGLGRECYAHAGSPDVAAVFREALIVARQAAFDRALSERRGYVETSPQTTFLAYAIAAVLPQSRFIHLVRDPREVVRSGMRRGWYAGHHYDRFRIVPRADDPVRAQWNALDPLAKNAWLWAETNRFIMSFLSELHSARHIRVRAEDMFAADPPTLDAIFGLLGRKTPDMEVVESILAAPMNAQIDGRFPRPADWSPAQRATFLDHAGVTARALGYELEDWSSSDPR
jgi:hypothetical protein